MAIGRIWDLVERLKAVTENISVGELQREVIENDDLLIVDIREVQERVDRGAIPGSVHVPRGMLEFWADPDSGYFRAFFRPERRTVLYCAGGGRSVLAAKALADLGYTDVAQLESGFDGWVAAGAEVLDVSATSKWMRRGGDRTDTA